MPVDHTTQRTGDGEVLREKRRGVPSAAEITFPSRNTGGAPPLQSSGKELDDDVAVFGVGVRGEGWGGYLSMCDSPLSSAAL